MNRIGNLRQAPCRTAILALFLTCAAGGANDQPRSLTIADLMKVRNIQDVRLSPDGKRVVYVVAQADPPQGGYDSDLWLVPARGGEPVRLTNGPKRDDTPRWSPSGTQIAFISDRDGTPQVWVIALTGGEARKLTAAGTDVMDFAWSPDGKYIAFLAVEPDSKAEQQRKAERKDVFLIGKQYKRHHLHLLDLAAQKSRQLTRGPFHVANFSWSPDGKHIAFARQPTAEEEDFLKADISVLTLGDKGVRKLVARAGLDTLPRWSPDGRTIAFVSHDGKARTWGDNTYLCVVPAEGGTPRNVSKAFDGTIGEVLYFVWEGFAWAADGKALYFTSDRGVGRHLFHLALDTGKVTARTSGNRFHDLFRVSRDGATMAFLATDPTTPLEVFTSPTDTFEPRRLTRTNPQLEKLALGTAEVVRWKSADQREIEGILFKPAGYRAGVRYPLLVNVHGGPEWQFSMAFAPVLAESPQHGGDVQVFASQGYAVLCPNPRGSNGYGAKFSDSRMAAGVWGGADYQDIMSGVDHLIARGLADPDRLGILGWSYGGYMTAWAVTQSGRFKAASVGAGITNLVSNYGQSPYPRYFERTFGGVPWKVPELVARRSPITHVGNVKTPTLILHGDEDQIVTVGQAKEFYTALKRNKVPVEFVVYPRCKHTPSEPHQQADVMRRNLEWFNRWLKKKSS